MPDQSKSQASVRGDSFNEPAERILAPAATENPQSSKPEGLDSEQSQRYDALQHRVSEVTGELIDAGIDPGLASKASLHLADSVLRAVGESTGQLDDDTALNAVRDGFNRPLST